MLLNSICRTWIPKKKTSNVGTSFVSKIFRTSCKKLNIKQVASSSYYYQSNGQVEACITFVKWTMKKLFDTNADVYLALLQIRSMPEGLGLPIKITILFSRPVRALISRVHIAPLNYGCNKNHHNVLNMHENKSLESSDTLKEPIIIPIGSTVATQCKYGGL